MGCLFSSGATKSQVEAIVQQSQENSEERQSTRELKAREQVLKAERDALERTLQESKEMHAQTLRELREARDPKAHEELLKAHEELLKAHEYLDDRHVQKMQEIESLNLKLKERVEKMEASLSVEQIESLNRELMERVDKMEISLGDVHGHVEERTRGMQEELLKTQQKAAEEAERLKSLQMAADEATQQRAAEAADEAERLMSQRRAAEEELLKSQQRAADEVERFKSQQRAAEEELLKSQERAPDEENPWLPHRQQWEDLHASTQKLAAAIDFRLSTAEGALNGVPHLDDLEVLSLHGFEGDQKDQASPTGEAKNFSSTPQAWKGTSLECDEPDPASPYQIAELGSYGTSRPHTPVTGAMMPGTSRPQSPLAWAAAEPHQEGAALQTDTAGDPCPPDSVAVHPPTTEAPEKIDMVQTALGNPAEDMAAGGPDSPDSAAATRPPTAPESPEKAPEPGAEGAGTGEVRSLRKEDVIEIGLKLHKIVRESARAG